MAIFEKFITPPFGYILDWLYQLTHSYGFALILFAAIVQAVVVPINAWSRQNSEKKRKLQPQIQQIRREHANDVDKQTTLMTELYNKEKVSLLGGYIMPIIPFFILIPIFQAVAQPITYLFHETPEVSASIVSALKEIAPELFTSNFNQVAAIGHIQEYAETIKAAVPEAATRTLGGIDYTFLGLNLGSVPMADILGSNWVWDWAHIGVVALPIVFYGRRIYKIFSGMIRSLVGYRKVSKVAAATGTEAPKMPSPPIVPLLLLMLTIGAMFAIPVALILYWLASSLFAELYCKLSLRFCSKRHGGEGG